MKETVLVVDDEAGVRASLAGILGDEGYVVDAVDSGEGRSRSRPAATTSSCSTCGCRGGRTGRWRGSGPDAECPVV
jgi:hypothetical protein